MQKCAAPTSNIEEGRGVKIKTVKNHKMSVQKIKVGRPNYLNSDEEALVVALTEIEGAHGLPIGVNTLGSELHFS